MHNDILADQIGLAAASVWVLERLKAAEWFPLAGKDLPRANRMIAALLALASTAGIHAAFEAHTGTLTITGLTGGNVALFFWEAFKAFAFQEGIFRATKRAAKANGEQSG